MGAVGWVHIKHRRLLLPACLPAAAAAAAVLLPPPPPPPAATAVPCAGTGRAGSTGGSSIICPHAPLTCSPCLHSAALSAM